MASLRVPSNKFTDASQGASETKKAKFSEEAGFAPAAKRLKDEIATCRY